MPRANFCVECGERLARKGWRARLGGRFCDHCTQRLGTFTVFRPLIGIALVAAGAFAVGRYMRHSPPPLIIQRVANSPLSDSPVEFARASQPTNQNAANNRNPGIPSEEGYICGARTKKGAPCRRRVHAVGDRCFQHKGLAAMVPNDKLVVKTTNQTK